MADPHNVVTRVCLRELVRSALALCAAILVGFLLVRTGSGFGVDERALDLRLGSASQQSIRAEAAAQTTSAALAAFVRRVAHGDLGTSVSFGQPVSELLRDRAPDTLHSLALAWGATVLVALWAALLGSMRSRTAGASFSGVAILLLSIPCSILALTFAWLRLPVAASLIVAVLPQTYRYTAGVLSGAARQPAVMAARARGVGGLRLWLRYAVWPAAPELLGVLSLTANLLIGAAIPIEALTGQAGLGHLVWQAALGRDLPLIAAMTMLVAIATLAAGSAAEIGAAVLRARRSA